MNQINDSLQNLNAGLVAGRDKNQSSTYTVPQYNRQQLTAMYRTGLAKRIVNQRAEDSFRQWREWQAKGVDISKIEAREKDIKVKQVFEKAQKSANLYGMSYVFIYIEGDDQEEPIDLNRVRAGSLTKLVFLERGHVGEGPDVQDVLDPYYDTPEYYQILTTNEANILTVHPSRMVVLFGTERLDQWGGDSILDTGMSDLKNLDATMANVASLVWEAKIDVVSIKGLQDAMRDPVEAKVIQDRINAAMFAKGNNGALILDADGEEHGQKQITFATLPDIIDRFEAAVATAFDYPLSILFKRQESGLSNNGGMSKEDYYNSVHSTQVNVLEPSMAMLDECLIRDALGDRPADLWYQWRPLWSLSAKDIADIGKVITETFTMAVEKGIVEINVANAAWVNAMTEAGAASGLEGLNAAFIGSLGQDVDDDDGGNEGSGEGD